MPKKAKAHLIDDAHRKKQFRAALAHVNKKHARTLKRLAR